MEIAGIGPEALEKLSRGDYDMDAYLSKPVRPEDLFRALKRSVPGRVFPNHLPGRYEGVSTASSDGYNHGDQNKQGDDRDHDQKQA